VLGIFKIGSQELFAWAGLKSRSSWSLSPEKLDHRCELLPPRILRYQDESKTFVCSQ
jgi:hypothetical protein